MLREGADARIAAENSNLMRYRNTSAAMYVSRSLRCAACADACVMRMCLCANNSTMEHCIL